MLQWLQSLADLPQVEEALATPAHSSWKEQSRQPQFGSSSEGRGVSGQSVMRLQLTLWLLSGAL